MTQKIIGLCGLIGSGKGTVADILANDHNFIKVSFAARLKDTAAVLFNWPRHLLEGDTADSRAWREEADLFWTSELGYKVTPRLALQLLGTDCIRKGFHTDIWTLTIKRQITENPNTNYVIPDVRFHNERDLIRSLGGQIWQVRRNDTPDWVNEAIKDNHEGTNLMSKYDIHESEYQWMDYDHKFDQILHNDSTINSLIQLTHELSKDIL